MSFVAFSQITITSTVTNVSCFGLSNGSATISVAGGTGAYTYTWLPGNLSATTLTGVAAGQYTVIVEDAVANTNSLVITIGQPSQLNIIAGSNNTCGAFCSGSAYLSAFGGTPVYTYIWSNGSNVPQVTNMCAGIYTVQVIDMNGCIASTTASILQSPSLNTNLTFTNAVCYNNCNGAASSNITGGTGPYMYQWLQTAAPSLTTANISNLCPGNYTLVAYDAAGCVETNTFILGAIGTIPNASATVTPYNETCYLSGDGAVDLTISGTNPGPFTYQWSNGANNQDLNNITTGNYWVTITDGASNCMSLQSNVYYSGVNCGSISGNTYIDLNSDCSKNIGEPNVYCSSIIVNPGNRLGYANGAGDYIVNNLPYGTYSVSLNMYYGSFSPTCTTTLTTNVNGGNQNSLNNNLSVGFNSSTNPDMKVSAYSNGIVPGFICNVYYQLSNLNNVPGTGLFKAVLPSAFIANISNGNPNTYTISGDTIIWNFSNIVYGAAAQFQISFTVPLSIPLGSTFTSCMWAQPNITDFDYANNNYCYSRFVTGSFDPNDKTVSPVGVGANGDIAATETDLTYLIRFQNTGNGPAVNIVVKDTLSPNVDVNTFEMLSASHNYNIDILSGNILRWKFNNIMLADSGSNEPASHGYIQYRIKRNNNNTPGTQIKNTAYIYFDFNEPVVTNTAINTIETITGIKSTSSNSDEWNVYPNPSTGVLYIVNSSSIKEASQIQVINSIGQTVLEETIINNYKNIDLSKLNNGVYFVKIVSDKSSTVKRIVLSK